VVSVCVSPSLSSINETGNMRRRITALVAATTSVVLLAFLVPAAYLVLRVARTNVETRAQSQMQSLIPLVALGDNNSTRVAVNSARTQGFLVWVTLTDGTVIGNDPAGGKLDAAGAQTATVTDIEASTGVPGGILFAQPVSRDGGTVVIRILATDLQLRAGVHRTWTILGLLGLTLFLLSLLVADRLARSLARPVSQLAIAAGQLEDGDLETRVEPDGPPEVREVGMALNRLAKRIVELLAAEREAVADLSHRLRTPLTALRLDAGSLVDSDERARLIADIDALDFVVDALIQEARRPVTDPMGAECDPADVLNSRLTFWTILAREQDRAINADIQTDGRRVRVGASELGAAVDALLGNVFAYTPAGTALSVRACPQDDGVLIVISDSGPGLDPNVEIERGRSGHGSTGLGLSIVRRTAESAGGVVTFGPSPTGGLEVSFTLGAPVASVD
jgi:signal transduction histidine kinase